MNSIRILTALAIAAASSPLVLPHAAAAMELQARGNPSLCVDLNQSNGTINLWACNAGANQNFFGGYGQQRFGNLCLDQLGAAGAPLAFTTCNANSRTQRWGLSPAGELKNEAGYCLDIPYGNVAQGQRLQMYQCNNGGNQKWAMSPAAAARPVSGGTPPSGQPGSPAAGTGTADNGAGLIGKVRTGPDASSGVVSGSSGGLVGKVR